MYVCMYVCKGTGNHKIVAPQYDYELYFLIDQPKSLT